MDNAAGKGEKVTPLQLMHIVYFSHALMLAIHHRPMITQEIEAWRDGPAISDLHRSTRKHGQGPVTERIDVPEEQYDQNERDIISAAGRLHTSLGGAGLAAATMSKGSPWHRKWHNTRNKSAVIPEPDIRKFHEKMVQEWSRRKAERARETKGPHPRGARPQPPGGKDTEGETSGAPGKNA